MGNFPMRNGCDESRDCYFFTQVEATNFFYFITCKIYQNKEKLLHNYQSLTSGCKNLETFIFSKIGQNCKKKKTSLKNWHAFAICIIGESITMYFQKLDANCAPIIRAAIKNKKIFFTERIVMLLYNRCLFTRAQ